MSLLVCAGCSTRYAVGLPACPHCASPDAYEEGTTPMPKISVHGGATHAADVPAQDPDAPVQPLVDAPAADGPAEAAPAPETATQPAQDPTPDPTPDESDAGDAQPTRTTRKA